MDVPWKFPKAEKCKVKTVNLGQSTSMMRLSSTCRPKVKQISGENSVVLSCSQSMRASGKRVDYLSRLGGILKAPRFLREHLRGSDRTIGVFIHGGRVRARASVNQPSAAFKLQVSGKNGAQSQNYPIRPAIRISRYLFTFRTRISDLS